MQPKLVMLLTIAAALAAAASAPAALKLPDPRICTYTSSEGCAQDRTVSTLIRAMRVRTETQWGADTRCLPVGKQMLRWRCTFRNAINKGSAVVVWNAKTFKPTFTLVANVCTPPLDTGGPPVVLKGCTATNTAPAR